MSTVARKDLKATLRTLQHEGWQRDRQHNSRGHVTLRHPCGARVTTSSTPGSWHAHKALMKQARRALEKETAAHGGRKG